MIEAWVTTAAGVYLGHLERSEASPFRAFRFSRVLREAGSGSLEFRLPNALLAATPTLLAKGNLVWMRYRGRTVTWVIEESSASTEREWQAVSGRGVRQMLGDRTVWPVPNIDSTPTPKEWGATWTTTTDGTAATGQPVIPLASTTGATVGGQIKIVGGGDSETGIIASVNVGVSITLEADLAHEYPAGSTVFGATNQWRRFVNRAAGLMLWDLISESNPRFGTQFTKGHIGVSGDDGWTQRFRFDSLLDIVGDVEELYGDVEFDGLEFNYFSSGLGTDRSADVVLEEGRDFTVATRSESDRDTLTWVLAEGAGEGVFAKTALGTNNLVSQRRREAYVSAKDLDTTEQLAKAANIALRRGLPMDAISVELTEDRYLAGEHYDLGDTITVRAESRGISDSSRVVAIYYGEEDERVAVSVDINTKRQERLLRLDRRQRDTARSLGVQNRQPQGQLVPFSFSGADVFDDTDTMDVFLAIPSRVFEMIEVTARIRFREFFAAAKSAASGGGSTSGASSASTSDNEALHLHQWANHVSDTPGAYTKRLYNDNNGVGFNLETQSASGLYTFIPGPHSHGIAHTHSTPDHTHALVYGVFKETYPVSHSVTLRVYELDAGAWALRATISGLTDDFVQVDLTEWIARSGDWRLELQSAGSQPNGGRLGCDVYGYVLGAIQSE